MTTDEPQTPLPEAPPPSWGALILGVVGFFAAPILLKVASVMWPEYERVFFWLMFPWWLFLGVLFVRAKNRYARTHRP